MVITRTAAKPYTARHSFEDVMTARALIAERQDSRSVAAWFYNEMPEAAS
jgi:hypothetical protein